MSENDTKELTIEVKDLSIEKEQHVDDLLRFLEEQLPQIDISRRHFLNVKMSILKNG